MFGVALPSRPIDQPEGSSRRRLAPGDQACVRGELLRLWRPQGLGPATPQREGWRVARCTVERLMRQMNLRGAIRGKVIRTTVSDKTQPGSARATRSTGSSGPEAPDRLWVADFTYVATWCGFVYVAFVIDAFARRIVGWRVARSAETGFVLDALEQALYHRRTFLLGLGTIPTAAVSTSRSAIPRACRGGH